MKISLIGPVYPYRGGIAHHTTFLAKALKTAGHLVQMISFERQYPAFLYPGETDKDPSANPARVDAQFLLDPLYPWTWYRTVRIILEEWPNLVVIPWWTTFWGPAYTALAHQIRKHVPVVFLIHNVLPHEAKPWDRWIARLTLGQGNAFIVQTVREKERLLDMFPHATVGYCEHPVYQRLSDETVTKEMARQRLGLPVDQPVFLAFGTVRPYKGLKVLINALVKADPSIHLVVAGEFWEDVDLYQRQINELGLNGRVTIFNKYHPNEEAHYLFSGADALIAPYTGGTQSGVVELALGYGLPIIASAQIANGIARGNLMGVQSIPAGDVPALARALTTLAESVQAETRREPAQDDWGRMVEAIEDICRNL